MCEANQWLANIDGDGRLNVSERGVTSLIFHAA
jgi:hypothetical protein